MGSFATPISYPVGAIENHRIHGLRGRQLKRDSCSWDISSRPYRSIIASDQRSRATPARRSIRAPDFVGSGRTTDGWISETGRRIRRLTESRSTRSR